MDHKMRKTGNMLFMSVARSRCDIVQPNGL